MFSGIWFSLGAMYLQVSQYQDAATAFTRALGVDDTDAQSWANLAAAYITMAQEKMNTTSDSEAHVSSARHIDRYVSPFVWVVSLAPNRSAIATPVYVV